MTPQSSLSASSSSPPSSPPAEDKTLYFAYGSNLSTSQMRKRCPTARLYKDPLAVLRGWRWIIAKRGYASIQRAGGEFALDIFGDAYWARPSKWEWTKVGEDEAEDTGITKKSGEENGQGKVVSVEENAEGTNKTGETEIEEQEGADDAESYDGNSEENVVYGLLYELDRHAQCKLDRHEGVAFGCYDKVWLNVEIIENRADGMIADRFAAGDPVAEQGNHMKEPDLHDSGEGTAMTAQRSSQCSCSEEKVKACTGLLCLWNKASAKVGDGLGASAVPRAKSVLERAASPTIIRVLTYIEPEPESSDMHKGYEKRLKRGIDESKALGLDIGNTWGAWMDIVEPPLEEDDTVLSIRASATSQDGEM